MWDYKIAMMAPEGASVKKGDVVLAFDATELKRALEKKENERDAAAKELEKALSNTQLSRRDAELRSAEAEGHLRKATLKLDRPSDLTGSLELAAARSDRELAHTEVAHQQAKSSATRDQDTALLAALNDKLARAEARIAETKDWISRMEVRSPRDATVIHASNWNEQKKKVGDSAWREEKVIETAALDEMIANGEIDEVDASKAVVGQHVTLRLDALPDVKLAGTVQSIGKTVQRQSKKNPLKVVRLKITLDKTSSVGMRPGMRFQGIAETERIAHALVIPTTAVFPTDHGAVAYRRTSHGFEAVPIKLGRRSRTHAEVLDGLREGDQVSRTDHKDPKGGP
jgi:HlyD family secretion protein